MITSLKYTYYYIVRSNPAHDEVYSIQHYVMKFISDLRQVGRFFSGIPVFSTNKTDRHDIAEILLKVALSTTSLLSMQIVYISPIVKIYCQKRRLLSMQIVAKIHVTSTSISHYLNCYIQSR